MKHHSTEPKNAQVEQHDVAHSPLDEYQRAVAGGPRTVVPLQRFVDYRLDYDWFLIR